MGSIIPTDRPKKVVVIGGGMAGMVFSLLATKKGHHITLFEKTSELGGHLLEGAVMDHKKEVDAYYEHLIREIKKSDVKVIYNTKACKKTVEMHSPDAVVVATGSVPVIPTIPGIDKRNVVVAVDLLKNNEDTGKHIIVVGGGLVGCETALHLAQKGKSVTVIGQVLIATSSSRKIHYNGS